MKDTIEEIYGLILYLGDNIKFDTPVICKMTPHSRPEIMHEISVDTDLESVSLHMLYTIRQRLRLLKYYKENENK